MSLVRTNVTISEEGVTVLCNYCPETAVGRVRGTLMCASHLEEAVSRDVQFGYGSHDFAVEPI